MVPARSCALRPDETVVWQYDRADRRPAASGGIAEAAGAGNQSRRTEVGLSAKNRMGRPRRAVGDSHWHSLDPVPSPGSGQRKQICLESLDGYIVLGLWQLQWKFCL